jgi:bacterioferritin-associated ferredoxin
MTGEERYYANSDEGEIKRLRSDLEHARGQLKHWQYLKEHYSRQAHAYAKERAQLSKLIDCAWSAQCGQCLNAAHALLEATSAKDDSRRPATTGQADGSVTP